MKYQSCMRWLPVWAVLMCCRNFVVSASDQSCSDDNKDPIDCHECSTYEPNSQFCADPFNATHPAAAKTALCRGHCAKWIRKASRTGPVHYVRTCSTNLFLKLSVALVCMKESRPGEGQLCFCHRKKCNRSNTMHHTPILLILVCLAFVLMPPSSIQSFILSNHLNIHYFKDQQSTRSAHTEKDDRISPFDGIDCSLVRNNKTACAPLKWSEFKSSVVTESVFGSASDTDVGQECTKVGTIEVACSQVGDNERKCKLLIKRDSNCSPIRSENRFTPGRERKTLCPPVREIKIMIAPVTEIKTKLAPVTEIKTILPPVTEVKTKFPPVTEIKTLCPPVREIKTKLPPVREIKTKLPPVRDHGSFQVFARSSVPSLTSSSFVNNETSHIPISVVKADAHDTTYRRIQVAKADAHDTKFKRLLYMPAVHVDTHDATHTRIRIVKTDAHDTAYIRDATAKSGTHDLALKQFQIVGAATHDTPCKQDHDMKTNTHDTTNEWCIVYKMFSVRAAGHATETFAQFKTRIIYDSKFFFNFFPTRM